MKKLLLGGIFLLVPLLVLGLLLDKAFDLSLRITRPVRRFVPIDTVGEIAAANTIAIFGILLLCLLAGLVARLSLLSGGLERFERLVVAAVPAYAVAKVALGAAARGGERDGDGGGRIVPVLVRFDDYAQIAFEVERNEFHVMLFLPGSPTVFAGASVRVDIERVTVLDLSFGEAVGLLQMLGRGTLDQPQLAELSRITAPAAP